ncbi:MAG: cytochrome c oxidase subunit 3 family protein [Bdellovibrio sp.]|nr:cytochrome c oxidase subunit 3 family protein [Bdellovibrio sp.]
MSTSKLINGVPVASHFRDGAHQYAANKEGLWLFMVTEILMFGGLFVGYVIFHSIYPEMFAEGAKYLDWRLGFVNTLVLIFSSFTMALGIYFIQVKQNKKATIALAITVICGAIFMAIKYFEYTHKFHLGLYPGRYLHMHEGTPEHANLGMYFGFYYCMSGLHGIHVLIGMGLIVWVIIKNMRGDFNEKYFTPVEGVGIFWHIIDLIWIFLFPLLYLVG